MGLAKTLYKLSRLLGKTSSAIRDIETLATGDPEKITKRIIRKSVYKTSNKIAEDISKKIK